MNMIRDKLIEKSIEMILSRSLKEGGFCQRQSGVFRPDATAWSILALSSGNIFRDLVDKACSRLALSQLPDGRVPVAEDLDDACWPTALAIMAWKSAGGFEKEINSAVRFLLKTSGSHFPREKNSPYGHDTAIRGWSWIEKTHSWVEPTSMAILALKTSGNGSHERVREAVKMILDRKLPAGGWNHGNTTVFKRMLPPAVEYTGHALCALQGFAGPSEVEKSIGYLKNEISVLRTPHSLCWGLFGLGAWSEKVIDAREHILNSLTLQNRYGSFNTVLLSQLVIAYNTEGNLLKVLIAS
jgi:hypothetical protein